MAPSGNSGPQRDQPLDEVKRRGSQLHCCYHAAGFALFIVLRGGTLTSLRIASSTTLLHLNGELVPAQRIDGFTDGRLSERECACGGYVPALSLEESFESYRDLNPSSRPIVLGPECADCIRFSIAHLAMLHAGSVATDLFMLHYYASERWLHEESAINRWFEEFSVLEPIKNEVIERAKILSAEIVSRERNAIKALAILLAMANDSVDGRQAESMIRNNMVSTEFPV